MTQGKPTPWRAVAINETETVFATHHGHARRGTPSWVMDDLAQVVDMMAKSWPVGEGTIVVQVPKRILRSRERWARNLVADAAGRGWSTSRTAVELLLQYGWVTFSREVGDDLDREMVHLGITEWISQARVPLFPLGADPELIATRLAEYDRLTGVPWQGTAGLSGCAAIRRSHERKTRGGQPRWRWDKAPEGVVGCAFELQPGRFSRPINRLERTMRHVLHFDTRAQYLSAAMTAPLGWGAPEHIGPALFDPATSGYWQVRRDQLPTGGQWRTLLPLLVEPGDSPLVWLTTSMLAYLSEMGVELEIMDSWQCRRTGRVLRGWGEAMRDVLYSGELRDSSTRKSFKQTYSRTVGMMARPGGRIYRPDWRDEIVDRAKIILLRKVEAAGLEPLRYATDAIFVACDEPAEEIGYRLRSYNPQTRQWSPQIGHLKLERTMTPDEYVREFETHGS